MGGICANESSDVFTGNTLIIKETKAIEVKGISNFENYEFHLSKDLKPQEPILIAKDGGCSWDKSKLAESGLCSAYTAPCPVKLSKTNITLCSKEAIEKEIKYTLIRSLQGFDGLCKKFTPPPLNKGPVVYKWNLEIVDSKDLLTSSSNSSKESGGGLSKDLVATLAQKTIALEAVALCIGHGTGILLANDGLACILKTTEESEELFDKRKWHIEAFAGGTLSGLNYKTDKTNPQKTKTRSSVAGARMTVELGGKD